MKNYFQYKKLSI